MELWICQWCGARCADYPTLREHLARRCKVMLYRRRRGWEGRYKPPERGKVLEDFK